MRSGAEHNGIDGAPRADARPLAPALNDPNGLTHPDSESATAHVAVSAGKIGLGTLASRVLGLVRDMTKAYFFGTGMAADAFTVAFRIPNLLRALLGEGTLSAAFVPVFGEYLATKDRREAWALAGVVWSLLAVVLVAVCLAGVLITPLLVKVMVYGYRGVPGKLDLTISLTRMMFPYIVFVGLAALAMGMLNSLRHFFAPAFSPVLLNVGMIAAMVILCPRMGDVPEEQVYGLAVGVLAGGAAQLAIQIPFLKKKGMSFRFRPDWHHPGVRRILGLMLPGLVGLGVLEINTFVDTFLGALLAPGSVAALEYGNRLMQLPLGIFGVALGTAILPTMAIQAAREDYGQLRDTFAFAVRFVCFIMIPAALALVVLRYPIVRLLFERGEFRHGQSVSMTTWALMFYASGLAFYGSVKCVAPVFYSLKDTRTPVKTAVTAMLANIVLNVILMQFLGLGGLALATALSSLLNLTLLLRHLRRRLGYVKGREILSSIARMGVAGGAMAAVCWVSMVLVERSGMPMSLAGRLAEVIVCGGVGVGAYVLACKLLRCPELGFAADLVRRRFGRREVAG
ncbi:MAG: murein biosynthesis integral membrane protein MurJ [Candidatus Eisenbacteria bacterium]|nr:murein biosynthesis integral membrane protein MurJ [Candidatus Eisenbacteria bacterium]